MSSQNAKWVERAGAGSQDLVDMGRHFQVAPDCDSKNLHGQPAQFHFQGAVDGAPASDHRTISISLDLLEFNLKLCLVAQRWNPISRW